jgi:hypothetical protein
MGERFGAVPVDELVYRVAVSPLGLLEGKLFRTTDFALSRSGRFKLCFGEDLRLRLPRFMNWGPPCPRSGVHGDIVRADGVTLGTRAG